jgi:hypothetical protein
MGSGLAYSHGRVRRIPVARMHSEVPSVCLSPPVTPLPQLRLPASRHLAGRVILGFLTRSRSASRDPALDRVGSDGATLSVPNTMLNEDEKERAAATKGSPTINPTGTRA